MEKVEYASDSKCYLSKGSHLLSGRRDWRRRKGRMHNFRFYVMQGKSGNRACSRAADGTCDRTGA